MKIFYIAVVRNTSKPAITLASAKDLSSFSFFERSVVADFMGFFVQTVAERTPAGQRQSVERDETYIGHTYSRPEGVAGVIIADKEYPVRVAYTLINKILDEFLAQHPKSEWSREYPAGTKDPIVFNELDTYIKTYQDPSQADSIMRVQQELDETKIVLHKTIESVLARGEKLDALVDKSEQLSNTSRQFYKQAKKTNSCCVIA